MKISLLSLLLSLGLSLNAFASQKVECTGTDEDGTYLLTQEKTKKGSQFVLEGTSNDGGVLVMLLSIDSSAKNRLGNTVYKGTVGSEVDTTLYKLGTYVLTLPQIAHNQAKLVLTLDNEEASVETLTLTCKRNLVKEKRIK